MPEPSGALSRRTRYWRAKWRASRPAGLVFGEQGIYEVFFCAESGKQRHISIPGEAGLGERLHGETADETKLPALLLAEGL
jgi:hypothetical protein